MHKLLKQNIFTENKIRSECRNYFNKMCLPRISSRANAEITLNKKCLLRIKSEANAEIT
jgi:hypothetical protein